MNNYGRCVCSEVVFWWLQVLQLGMMTPRQANKQRRVLKRALSETYLNLVLLQNFQQLNHTGFRKILKKHDKLTHSSHGKEIFENAVCHSYFWTSKNVNRMIGQVEKSMIQLEDGNRTKAMNRLRVPPLGTEHHRSHWTSYFAGLFSGLLLLSIVVVCIAFSQWPTENYSDPHLEPSLRAMRAGLVLCIWFYGFAVNTFGWRRAGVNNVLIFEFDPRNYLTFMELFAVCVTLCIIYGAHRSITQSVCSTYTQLMVPYIGGWHGVSHMDGGSVPDSLLCLAAHISVCGTSGDVWCAGLCPRSPIPSPQTTIQNMATEENGMPKTIGTLPQ